MKSFIKLLLFVFTINITAQKNVWKGDLYPKDFTNFQKGAYNILEGDLRVYDTKLTDLTDLKSLKSVRGNVYIGINSYKQKLKKGNKLLTSLNGLNNLESISGGLEIYKNKLLENISALKKLKKVNKINICYSHMLKSLDGLNGISGEIMGLQIYKNKRLQDISQLSKITLVRDHLVVNSNLSLKSLEGLHNVKAVEKGYLSIRSNTYLEGLRGLRKIEKVDEEVYITGNPVIKNLEGLNKLNTVLKTLMIRENESLENLKGLESLKSIGGNFEVAKNKKLISLKGLKKLTAVGDDLVISKNPLLTEINDLNTIKNSLTNIYIHKNSSLTKITGLNKITEVRKDLSLTDNHLEKITGFNNLKTIGKYLNLYLNHIKKINGFKNLNKIKIFSFDGDGVNVVDFSKSFKKLTHVSFFYITGKRTLEHFQGPNSITELERLVIRNNKKLISLSGFNGLKLIKEELVFEENQSLKSIEGFNSLKNIERFCIQRNSNLESIKGFNKINFIDDLYIYNNRKLVDLSGFRNLKSANDIYIKSNYSLEDLSGFKSLQKVNIEFDLHNNSELKSLNGLENLNFIGKGLDFTNNVKLIDYKALQYSFIQSLPRRKISIDVTSKEGLLIHERLDTKIIPEEYLKLHDKEYLSVFREEIYARKGFVFSDKELRDYFLRQGWYEPKESVVVFNDIEKKNIKLIEKHTKLRIDMATNAMLNLKKQYHEIIGIPNGYEKYYPILNKFIEGIDIDNVSKANKLSYSSISDIDENIINVKGKLNDELDNLSIHFDYKEKMLHIIIEDNYYLEEEDEESWLVNKIVTFDFIIKNDFTIEFLRVFEE